MCEELFKKTLICVETVLHDAKIAKDDIDEIVLVGGSSRIPKIQSMLSNFFNNKTLNKSVNPDEVVACGAAIQAAILNHDQHSSVRNLLLMNVNPLSIGIQDSCGVTHKVILRNTSIPVTKLKTDWGTSEDNQTSMRFSVTEGIPLYIQTKL